METDVLASISNVAEELYKTWSEWAWLNWGTPETRLWKQAVVGGDDL